MRVKKYLEQQAEKDRQAIMTEGDEKFLQETMARIDGAPSPTPRSSSKLKSWLTASCAVACVVGFVCFLVFYPQGQGAAYLENNFVKSDSTLQEMDADMKKFAFDIDETLYTVKVQKTTDSVSRDVIMYEANISSNDSLVKMSLFAVCNENYQYHEVEITDEFVTEKLAPYDICYQSSTVPQPDFGVNYYSAQAQIRKGKEYIYIKNYVETVFDGQPQFLDLVQTLIK